MACLRKLNAVIDEATGAWGPPDYFATSLSHWEHRFQLDTASWMYTDAWPYEADVLVAFLTDCVHLREGVVASDADWLGLDEVRAILPDADAGDGETAIAGAVAQDKPAVVDHGWLLLFQRAIVAAPSRKVIAMKVGLRAEARVGRAPQMSVWKLSTQRR